MMIHVLKTGEPTNTNQLLLLHPEYIFDILVQFNPETEFQIIVPVPASPELDIGIY
jgi:hypothetical protein